jgi:hypothetical protein
LCPLMKTIICFCSCEDALCWQNVTEWRRSCLCV